MDKPLSKPTTKRRIKSGEGDPWAALAGAVLLRAVEDARGGDSLAVAWLLREGLFYLDGLGLDVDPEYLKAWVNSGCPGVKQPVERPRIKNAAQFPGQNTNRRIIGDPGIRNKLPVYATGRYLLENGTKKHHLADPLGKRR